MEKEVQHRERVINYYNIAQRFFEFFWHGRALGLHYGFWVDNVADRKEAILKENEILAELANIKRTDLVLDAGCGVSGSGLWLAKEKGAQVVGLNIVKKQLTTGIKLAERRSLLQKLEFVEGDYQKLPFKSESFDVFWALESIEHATNVDVFIEDAFRVLKNDGRIVIAGTFRGRQDLSDEEERQLKIFGEAAGVFNDFRTAEDVLKLLQRVGFCDIQNLNRTEWVMKSAREMAEMCQRGLSVAKIGAALRITSPILVLNNQWGFYQEGLFKSGAISYNVLIAEKP